MQLDTSRNLTETQISENFNKFMVVVFETNSETGSKSDQEFFEGSKKDCIKFFNKNRADIAASALGVLFRGVA
jgi:hypothetical protein